MEADEIRAHAENAYPGQPALQAYMLARWAAYGDPVELPAGWLPLDTHTTATGIHQMAVDPAGRMYRDAPARRIPWTCPAGVEHRRYWRELHRARRVPRVACEHTPEAVPFRPAEA